MTFFERDGDYRPICPPTGRAAQRLSEMAGLEAKTIHRLLEFDPATRGFKRGLDNLLPDDALVIDEASMLDLFLANSLLKAIARQEVPLTFLPAQHSLEQRHKLPCLKIISLLVKISSYRRVLLK